MNNKNEIFTALIEITDYNNDTHIFYNSQIDNFNLTIEQAIKLRNLLTEFIESGE